MPNRAVLAILKAASGVTDLVGSGTAARIRDGYLDESWSLPAITFSRVGSDREMSMSGPVGINHARYEVNSWAATSGGAWRLAAVVQGAMNGTTGTHGTIYVQLIELDGESKDEIRFPAGSDTWLHVVSQEYDVHVSES